MTPEQFAKGALSAISKKKAEVYIGKMKERAALLIKRFFPNLFFKMAKKIKPA
jgi:short-subunit dehydrogenase